MMLGAAAAAPTDEGTGVVDAPRPVLARQPALDGVSVFVQAVDISIGPTNALQLLFGN